MRAFVALEISDPKVLDSIVAFQGELSKTGADLKLIERQNLHFTVKFLGEITESQVKEVDARLKALHMAGALVDVIGVGAFPNIGRPNVIWVGVPAEQEGRVGPIAQAAIASLEGLGERDSRPFVAHATVARVRSGNKLTELTSVLRASSDRAFGPLTLTQLKLKSSTLTPQGPTYADMGVYALG